MNASIALTGARRPLAPRPSRAVTIDQGFGGVTRFFPGARAELAAIDDEVVEAVLGPTVKGRALAFEDQYISNAGQLYELAMGHDRWVAELRPLIEPMLARRGRALGICSHPYDLSTELIAREAGVLVTDPSGGRLSAPLDVFTDVAFVAYANQAIRSQVDPPLRAALRARGLLPEADGDVDAGRSSGSSSIAVVPSRSRVRPGRLDVMGGIADYSGALVLEMPIAAATWVAAQASDEPEVVIESDDIRALGGEATVTLPLAELVPELPAHVRARPRPADDRTPDARGRPTPPARSSFSMPSSASRSAMGCGCAWGRRCRSARA